MYQRECPEAKSHGVGGALTVARKATGRHEPGSAHR